MFDSVARNGLVLNVACWEWDTGDGNDNSIGENLIKLNDNRIFTIIWAAIGAAAPTLVGLLMDLTSFAISVVSIVAKNDLSSSRSLYLDRHTLAALSQSGSAQWHFNGDGHHELKVRFGGDPIPFPVSSLECAVLSGTTWSASALRTLPFESMSPSQPALAEHNGNLYCAVRGSDRKVYVSRYSAGQWSGFGAAPGVLTDAAPTLLSFDGYLFLAHTALSGQQCLSHSTNGADWTPPLGLPFNGSGTPALAERGGGLHYATLVGTQIRFSYSSQALDPAKWVRLIDVPGAQSHQAPAMATLDGRLYLAYTTGNGQAALTFHDGATWSAPSLLQAATDAAPAIAVHDGNKLAYAVRGSDDKVWLSHHAGHEAFNPVPNTVTTHSTPNLVTYSGKLHLGYRTVT
ncbi:hypothetical protein ACFU8I_35285 [Streptomyces sp. NPDC057540]|uniref:hypothetical protein n=1 Tax=Streptomyces sp. NPDC057540 TaxID=3346160 RepID=UPI00367630E4